MSRIVTYRRRHFTIHLLVLLIVAGCAGLPPVSRAPLQEAAFPEADAQPSARPLRTAASEPIGIVPLGYHYKPPTDGTSAETIAQQARFIILTKNDEDFRDQLRRHGYKGPILQYIRGSEAEGPPTQPNTPTCHSNVRPLANQVADQRDDFCTLLHPHEDWFLHNGQGERLYQGERRFYHMNPASEGWRAFVLERLKLRMFGDEETPPLGYDGIFFDNVELNLNKARFLLTNSDGTVQEFQSDQDFREAWRGWLEYMRQGLGPGIPIWANLIGSRYLPDEWNLYLPYLDGVMNEAFATGYRRALSPQAYRHELEQAEYALAHGKGVYAVGQGSQNDTARQTFALASFLLIAQPYAPNYFRYSSAQEGYLSWWDYPNQHLQIGVPLGARYATKHGWRRDFTNGYVEVDLIAQKGKINLHPLPGTTSPPASAPTPGQ
ncbi:putative glycoside hydrolase [Kallotenue papyrolyticum]|uniref:putative glycoside hydrolase n=1 Tax=Kallotenue papyrolyticum TaxID=1325125 RepID=UPI001376F8D4|nr:putative glycoside hydrolase [Kallotenue papyrolyticum]